MCHKAVWLSGLLLVFAGSDVFGQIAAPPRVGRVASEGNQSLRSNSIEPGQPAAMNNRIVQPVPLSAEDKDSALAGIDRHIAAEVGDLKEKLKHVLPDELSMLAKTAGWKAAEQQALVVALRAGDPAAVFEAWTQAAPQDTAGAEISARQTDVRRTLSKLEQDVEKNKAALRQDVADLDTSLTKIAATTPPVADVTSAVKSLSAWVEARNIVQSAEPGKGPIAMLPKGNVSLIYDPTLAVGTAVVLNKEAMLIGNEGHPGLLIKTGNAAEALGLPIVTGSPLDEAEWPEMTSGIMLANRFATRATINYNLNGTHYIMEPGMAQRLPEDRTWVVEFDRGESYGPASYTVTPGTYHFTQTDMGWQLYKQRFDVVLDNSQSKQEFNFLFRGENMSVPAGGTKTLTAEHPIVVKFDRGNGSAFAVKMMHFSGNVQVGVNATDNLWDLFPTNENQREVTKLKLFQ